MPQKKGSFLKLGNQGGSFKQESGMQRHKTDIFIDVDGIEEYSN